MAVYLVEKRIGARHLLDGVRGAVRTDVDSSRRELGTDLVAGSGCGTLPPRANLWTSTRTLLRPDRTWSVADA